MIRIIWILVPMMMFFGCTEKDSEKVEPEIPKHLIDVTLDFHENGKPKNQELYQLKDGVKSIYGFQELYPSGKRKIIGTYNPQKQREGKWESFYENGNMWSIGTFDNGVANGESVVWYENGEMRYNGKMREGKPVGLWEYWDENGVQTEKKFN